MHLSCACCWGCSSASHRCASRRGRGRGRVCCHWLWASLVLGEKMLSKIHSKKFWEMRGDVTSSALNDILTCWRTNLKVGYSDIVWYDLCWLQMFAHSTKHLTLPFAIGCVLSPSLKFWLGVKPLVFTNGLMTLVVSFFEEYMLSKMIWQNSERLFTWIKYFWAFADVDYWQDQDGQHVKNRGKYFEPQLLLPFIQRYKWKLCKRHAVVPSILFNAKISFFSRSSYYACHHATYVLNSFLGSRSKNISSRMNLSSACCWGCSSASHRCASRRGRGTGRPCCHWLWASLVLGEKMLSKIHSESFWKMRGDVTSSVL